MRQGLTALLGGFLIAIAAAVIFGVAIRWSGRTPTALQLLLNVGLLILVGAAALRVQRLIWHGPV